MNFEPCKYQNKLNMPPPTIKNPIIFFIYVYKNYLPRPKPLKEVHQECFSLLISFFGMHKVIMVLTCFEGQRFQRNRILNLEVDYRVIIRMVEILRNFKTSRDPSHWVRRWSSVNNCNNKCTLNMYTIDKQMEQHAKVNLWLNYNL